MTTAIATTIRNRVDRIKATPDERHKVDLVHNPAWAILQNQHRDLEGVDLARFTFELDDAVEEVFELVATIFGAAAAKKH